MSRVRDSKVRSWLGPLFVTGCALVFALLVTGQAHAQAVKIGVFDATRISEETEEGKRVQAALNDLRNQKQAELTAKEQELAGLQNQLNSQALSLSGEKRSELEKQIQKKALELKQNSEAATREMQIEFGEAQNKFQEQLLAVIQQFGRDEGFTLILESSLIAYADNSIDVTTALVDRFDKLFAAAPPPADPGN
jgi:outer membrane protein